MRILITGGAGFVGSALAERFKLQSADNTVCAFDNLRRRGSELNLARFKKLGIEFVHGDIRVESDLMDLAGNFDVMLECSAEPSVLAGLSGSPAYVLDTNLKGTLHCLEFARKRVGAVVFLSTSRVYSIKPLRELQMSETATRFELKPEQNWPGVSEQGISEQFPTSLARSLYGATKLASELVVQEYVDTYKMKAVINRCGVIAGPGQFGKVDQGVFTLWAANHYFKKTLTYTGFGGAGKQVRDLLHPGDLFDLIALQLGQMDKCSGEVFNAGGGRPCSVSLLELTKLCQELTGNSIAIGSNPASAAVDIPLYLTDGRKVEQALGWKPKRSARHIFEEIVGWLKANEEMLAPIFG